MQDVYHQPYLATRPSKCMIICCISAATSLLFLGPLEYSASTGFGVYRVHAFWLGVNGVQALGFTDGFVGFWVSLGGV